MRLGWANVNALARSLTARQLLEWEAYARIEPFNEFRADHRAALIASMIFNMAVSPKDRKPSNDELFQLRYDDEKESKPEVKENLFEKIKILSVIENSAPQEPEKVNDGYGRKDLEEQLAKARAAMGR